MMRRVVRALAIVFLGAATRLVAEDERVIAGEGAATSWLAIVDAGKYGESWDAAAAAFRAAITRAQWEAALDQTPRPLGKVLSRKLRSATFMTEVPKAPPGEYVVVEFDTSFENRPCSVERVTPMKENDGTWKVSGYYLVR